MKKNKKAVFYSITVLIFTIFILIFALIAVYKKTSPPKKIGEEQMELIKHYQEGENILFYIDQSAKYSAYNGVYSLAQKGLYFDGVECGNSLGRIELPTPMGVIRGYTMWENVISDQKKECYPTERDIAMNFNLFMNNQLNGYLDNYPDAAIPKNNYDFNFNEKNMEIKGLAAQNILIPLDRQRYKAENYPKLPEDEKSCLSREGYVIPRKLSLSVPTKENENTVATMSAKACGKCPPDSCDKYQNEIHCNLDTCNINCIWKDDKCEKQSSLYSFKPSFKIGIPFDFIKKFSDYSTMAQEIRDNIKDCLIKGSETPDDDEDLITCAEKENKEASEYKIRIEALPDLTSHDRYLLLFDIEDKTFENPYSEDKLVIKFGIRFMDHFPPPKTEIKGIEEKTVDGIDGKYLVFKKNDASDVKRYDIYYKKIESTGEIKTEKPKEISKMKGIAEISIIDKSQLGDEIEWLVDYDTLEAGSSYYFYILAIDHAGNPADEIKQIEQEVKELTI